MVNATSLSKLIKQLKAELIKADQDSSDLSISSAEITLGITISENNDGQIYFHSSDTTDSLANASLKLNFAKDQSAENSFDLTAINDATESDDFEGFKKRFEKNVKLKHGQRPSKKKSIFDD